MANNPKYIVFNIFEIEGDISPVVSRVCQNSKYETEDILKQNLNSIEILNELSEISNTNSDFQISDVCLWSYYYSNEKLFNVTNIKKTIEHSKVI
jgi:hypothetical protein